MLPEIVQSIENPLLLIGALLLGAFFGMMVEQHLAMKRRKAWQDKNRKSPELQGASGRLDLGPRVPPTVPSPWKPLKAKVPDAAEQLRIVMSARFAIQPLLNRSEARVFKELDRLVLDRNPGWQVMAQVSLGEILRCKEARAYGCVNSKRVDLLLVDEDCRPRHALEYQGVAHHQGDAAARDAVKKEALRQAGVGYHEVVAGHTTPSDLRRLVEKLVDNPATAE